MTIPKPEDQPTVSLWPTAAKALGIGRSAAYEGAERGDLPIPVLRVGHRLVVPTAALRRVLHLDLAEDGAK